MASPTLQTVQSQFAILNSPSLNHSPPPGSTPSPLSPEIQRSLRCSVHKPFRAREPQAPHTGPLPLHRVPRSAVGQPLVAPHLDRL
eukprot:CAMPEP_0184318692 /NCGR_PEP_ID=MMETSP1049-20130417/104119_1 /TAXON_ID=77928 /ORGANISM="Proteomonas sulcata, Strain CCMP704" /LENGTH=85 /DNA_ID=CAMNT_0026638549 /DNA_START=555 /DNA_END=808 /DNA_ORIENTATION=-